MKRLTKKQIIMLHSELTYTQEELSDIVLEVAAGKQSFGDMVQWIINHQA